ncbi:prenyltransferase/squalene oxidase repeat-containing protein [Streptomyces avermitilis]|uniref:prenyltransferase/squalene oxidase repeat-containing protein n=1 Tax=Streptomyces avermitilis TaxID=33903 RepID=UPI0036C841CA
MIVRRSAAVLAVTAVIGGATAPAALADDASPSASPSRAFPSALYGSTDPTYDGVWRQSLALLAQHTVGVRPAAKAVDWLTGQQCASGAFAPYRADASAKCDAKTMVDTNSTAAAVQALAALGGHDAEVGQAVRWLKDVQNKDGGWGYTAGGASDTNSTSVVIGALAAAGDEPKKQVKNGKSPYDALLALSVPCDKTGGGAFAFQPDKKGALAANADATAVGVVGSLGKGFVIEAAGKASKGSGESKASEQSKASGQSKGSECASGDSFTPADAAHNGASYLAAALAKTPYLKSAMPGAKPQPDYGNTADAVVALAAAGSTSATAGPLAWLEKNSGVWAAKAGPAAYAQLIFAARAAGAQPRDFGGVDLVEKLGATGPAAQAPSRDSASSEPDAKKVDHKSAFNVWWLVGVCLVAGIGIGFLLSRRNKRQQL